jgi:hypothetical protein
MNKCDCPCVVRLALFRDKDKDKCSHKYIRLSCKGTLFVHDKNEVLRYKSYVIDDEIPDSCGVSGDRCADCIALCKDRLVVIEFTSVEGLKKHIINDNQICRINKIICENQCIDKSGKSLSEVLVLLGISDPTNIRYIIENDIKCLRNSYGFEIAYDLESFCNYLCSIKIPRLNIFYVIIK